MLLDELCIGFLTCFNVLIIVIGPLGPFVCFVTSPLGEMTMGRSDRNSLLLI